MVFQGVHVPQCLGTLAPFSTCLCLGDPHEGHEELTERAKIEGVMLLHRYLILVDVDQSLPMLGIKSKLPVRNEPARRALKTKDERHMGHRGALQRQGHSRILHSGTMTTVFFFAQRCD